jgi:hypothetical protein
MRTNLHTSLVDSCWPWPAADRSTQARKCDQHEYSFSIIEADRCLSRRTCEKRPDIGLRSNRQVRPRRIQATKDALLNLEDSI